MAAASSTGGRSNVRTTMRWLAMPSRTRVGSSCSAKSVLMASVRAAGSETSPSRMTPGRKGATAPRVRVMEPLAWTSAAARWPGSSSRPTTAVLDARFLLNTVLVSARANALLSGAATPLTTKRGPEAPLRESRCRRSDGLPAVVLAAGRGARAGTLHGAAVGLRHRERRVGLRRRGERVALARAADRGQVRVVQGRLDGDEGGLGDAVVRLVVGVIGLHRRRRVADEALGGRVLGLLTLAEEGRQGDRGKDADDQDDDQELDEGEA